MDGLAPIVSQCLRYFFRADLRCFLVLLTRPEKVPMNPMPWQSCQDTKAMNRFKRSLCHSEQRWSDLSLRWCEISSIRIGLWRSKPLISQEPPALLWYHRTIEQHENTRSSRTNVPYVSNLRPCFSHTSDIPCRGLVSINENYAYD